jgi:formylglycine-generating enzyme required for sulfatase activity
MRRNPGLALCLILAVCAAAQAVTIDWVTVGNAPNAADTRYDYPPGYGAVANPYRISRYETTAGQYTEFLNAVAATDTYALYNTSMWSSTYGCKIQRSNSPGSYTYSVAADRADRPVNNVSLWDAARFANWMHNGQGSADTESGAYINVGNQATFARLADALFFIATENEWYKAAYYDPNKGGPGVPGYWTYPTMSDTAPSNQLIDPDPGNNATFYDSGYTIDSPYYTTVVGAHENSASAYGTFDQGGNLWEWNEAVLYTTSRGIRGGSWYGSAGPLSASSRYYIRSVVRVLLCRFSSRRFP